MRHVGDKRHGTKRANAQNTTSKSLPANRADVTLPSKKTRHIRESDNILVASNGHRSSIDK